jgi:hypothetical protein
MKIRIEDINQEIIKKNHMKEKIIIETEIIIIKTETITIKIESIIIKGEANIIKITKIKREERRNIIPRMILNKNK